MFGWIGGIIDCALGKNRKIIQNQSNTINGLKAQIQQKNKKIIKQDADLEANRDIAHKSVMEVARANDELAAERSKHRKLLVAEEEIFLEQLRIENAQELERQARKAENALKAKIKKNAKAKRDGPKLDDNDLL